MTNQVPESYCGQSISHDECQAVSDACLHLLHSGLFTSSSLNRCPFDWQCPVSSHAIFLSRFLLKLNNSPTFFAEGFLRQPLACLCLHVDCQCSWKVLLLVQSQITPLAALAGILSVGWSHTSGCDKSCLASWSAVSFPSISMSPGTHTSWILLCSAVLPGIDGSPRLILNLSWNCQGPWWLPDCQKEYRYSYLCCGLIGSWVLSPHCCTILKASCRSS